MSKGGLYNAERQEFGLWLLKFHCMWQESFCIPMYVHGCIALVCFGLICAEQLSAEMSQRVQWIVMSWLVVQWLVLGVVARMEYEYHLLLKKQEHGKWLPFSVRKRVGWYYLFLYTPETGPRTEDLLLKDKNLDQCIDDFFVFNIFRRSQICNEGIYTTFKQKGNAFAPNTIKTSTGARCWSCIVWQFWISCIGLAVLHWNSVLICIKQLLSFVK